MSERFKNLTIWQLSHEAVLEIYKITGEFPREEKYGITSQIRRAAVSVPTNIVEGRSRCNENEFRQFLNIAQGSCCETMYLLYLSKDLGFLQEKDFIHLYDKYEIISKMIFKFVSKIGKKGIRKSAES